MSTAEYILPGQYVFGALRYTPPSQRSRVTPGTRTSCPAGVDQIFGAPVFRLATAPQLPGRVGFVCVVPEELPILRSVENIPASENCMHDELSAVGQSIDPALS